MQNADIALYETAMQLQFQRMELYQANWSDSKREKGWLCDELELRNTAFHEDRARKCQEIEELRRIAF